MEKSFRIVVIVALIAAGVWGWRALFPSPEKVIRSRLKALAATASFEPEEGTIPRAFKAQKAAGYFTADAVVSLEPRGYPAQLFNGRDELQEAALAGTRGLRGLKVEFLDINVTLGPDKQSAVANLTCKVTPVGERDFSVMELNCTLKKVNGAWLIHRVETVKTLSLNRRAGFRPGAIARLPRTPPAIG